MTYDKRPKTPDQQYYADYDEDTACYGVFGYPSGFCYELHADKITAQEKAVKREQNLTRKYNDIRRD